MFRADRGIRRETLELWKKAPLAAVQSTEVSEEDQDDGLVAPEVAERFLEDPRLVALGVVEVGLDVRARAFAELA